MDILSIRIVDFAYLQILRFSKILAHLYVLNTFCELIIYQMSGTKELYITNAGNLIKI